MGPRRSAGGRALLSCPWWQRLSAAGTPGLSGVVKKLGAALSRHTAGQEEGEAISHLWSRMGILLQRGNGGILGNRVPALPWAHIDGII